jgi:hypothetical protein
MSELVDFRSSNVNLAVPMLMCSEPGLPQKTTLKEGLVVDIWDIWRISAKPSDSLDLLLTNLEKAYGLKSQDVFYDSKPIYIRAIEVLNSQNKKEKPINELLKLSPDTETFELTVTFILPEQDDGSKCLEGVPTILVELEKPAS